VIQVNKRDLPDAVPMEMLRQVLSPDSSIQMFEAVAAEFKGVFEPLRAVSTMVLEKLAQKA
jgi:signal recognition particle receptor subunit beta